MAAILLIVNDVLNALDCKKDRCDLRKSHLNSSVCEAKKKKEITYRHIHRYNRKPNERACIRPFTALRSVTQSKDETHDKQAEIEIVDDEVEDLDPTANMQ